MRFEAMIPRGWVGVAGGPAIAAAVIVAGCLGDLGVSGTLAVDVAGLGARPVPADGGRISVAAGGGPTPSATGTLSVAGVWASSLPEGDYVITYSPPEGYRLASGDGGIRSTHVSTGVSSSVSFDVVVDSGAIGTLVLSVTGLSGNCDPGRVTVVLQRTDASHAPQTVAIPRTGVDSVTVISGVYSIANVLPGGYQANGPTRVVGVSVPAGGIAPVVFAVRATDADLLIVADLAGPPWPFDGGSVTLLRIDSSAQLPAPISVPLYSSEDYFAAVSLVPGRYAASYAPPTGFRSTPDAGTVDVSLCPADLANLTFAAAPAPAPAMGVGAR